MKKRSLYHPLWTHIPAIIVLAVSIFLVIRALPLPSSAPVHIGFSGRPDRYGSPWDVIGGTIFLSVLYLVLSIVVDELWARYEKRKTFNWMSMFDEIAVGISSGITISYLRMLITHDYSRPFYLKYILLTTIPALAVSVLLELLRPYHPHSESIVSEDTDAVQAEVAASIKSGRPMVYWESQQVTPVTIAMTALGLAFLLGAILSLGEPWLPYILLFNGCVYLAIAFIFNGITVTVTPENLVVKLQSIGKRLFEIGMEEIAKIEPYSFSPLGDFGGWGVRWNGKIKAYYWRGNRGVLLTTNDEKKFLIGSDNPERLAAVIQAIRNTSHAHM